MSVQGPKIAIIIQTYVIKNGLNAIQTLLNRHIRAMRYVHNKYFNVNRR